MSYEECDSRPFCDQARDDLEAARSKIAELEAEVARLSAMSSRLLDCMEGATVTVDAKLSTFSLDIVEPKFVVPPFPTHAWVQHEMRYTDGSVKRWLQWVRVRDDG